MLMGAARTVLLGCLMVGAACATTNNSSFDRRALQDSCADLDGDGVVSVTDLLTVRQPTRLARVTATDGPANP
jgi:hypothetical protein